MTLRAAAAGAAVVSTTFGDKRSLTEISQNILCAAPDKRTLLETLRTAVTLAADAKVREQHRASDHLSRDWNTSFAKVLDVVATRLGLNS
jgi:hypothetical protein